MLFYGPAFFTYNLNPVNKVKPFELNSSALLLTLFVLGYFLGNYLFKKFIPKDYSYINWVDKPDIKQYINPYTVMMISAFCIVILFLGLFVYGGLASLKDALTNPVTAEDVDYLRANRAITGWVASPFDYISQGIGKFFSVLVLGYGVISKNRIIKYIGILFTSLLALALAGGLSKSALIFYVIQIVVFVALLKNIKVNFVKIFGFSVVILVALISIYLFATIAENTGTALEYIAYRIFGEPNRVLNLYSTTWPNDLPHTWGLNIRVIHNLIGEGTYLPASEYLCEGKIGCTFNCMFIGDAWVDFSYYGVFIQSILVGALLCYLDYLIFSKKGLISKALIAALISSLFAMTSVGLITCFITFGLVSCPVFAYLFRIKFINTLSFSKFNSK